MYIVYVLYFIRTTCTISSTGHQPVTMSLVPCTFLTKAAWRAFNSLSASMYWCGVRSPRVGVVAVAAALVASRSPAVTFDRLAQSKVGLSYIDLLDLFGRV